MAGDRGQPPALPNMKTIGGLPPKNGYLFSLSLDEQKMCILFVIILCADENESKKKLPFS